MHSSLVIADHFLELAAKDEPQNSLTPMQVIKLVYLAHGWNLGIYSRPLIRETVQAWRYGPVIKELYRKIKRFGSKTVEGPIAREQSTLNAQELDIVHQTYDIYGRFTGLQLSTLTHQPGSPWYQVYVTGRGDSEEISDSIIENYYQQKHQAAAAARQAQPA